MRSIFPEPFFDPGKLAVSVSEAAKRCDLSEEFIRKEVAAGKLKLIRGGKKHIIAVAELKRWLNKSMSEAA